MVDFKGKNNKVYFIVILQIFKNLGLPQVLEMYVKGVESSNTLHTNEVSVLAPCDACIFYRFV